MICNDGRSCPFGLLGEFGPRDAAESPGGCAGRMQAGFGLASIDAWLSRLARMV